MVYGVEWYQRHRKTYILFCSRNWGERNWGQKFLTSSSMILFSKDKTDIYMIRYIKKNQVHIFEIQELAIKIARGTCEIWLDMSKRFECATSSKKVSTYFLLLWARAIPSAMMFITSSQLMLTTVITQRKSQKLQKARLWSTDEGTPTRLLQLSAIPKLRIVGGLWKIFWLTVYTIQEGLMY